MRSAVPFYRLAPLEYRVALDAACVWLSSALPALLRCENEALQGESLQRLSFVDTSPWQSALWVEPQVGGWERVLDSLSRELPPAARLAVMLSLPPARRLPGRQCWTDAPLGIRRGGLHTLLREVECAGFSMLNCHELHSGQSIFINLGARLARAVGQNALGDRMEFFARQHYTKSLGKAWRATCALALAVKL